MAKQPEYGPQNPHPLSVLKTELVWEGKYDEYGNRRTVDVAACAMPMQRIETIDEPRRQAVADGKLALFEKEIRKKRADDFRNMLIWGDNKLVMASLLKDFKGKIDLIYIDPPFNVDTDFSMDVPIGEGRENVEKGQSTLEMVAYRDIWGKGTDSYLHMMYERLLIMYELLSDKGSIYLHCDDHMNYLIRPLMNEIFSQNNFTCEIIWQRVSSHNDADRFGRVHDTIFLFTKSKNYMFNPQVRSILEKEIEKKALLQ